MSPTVVIDPGHGGSAAAGGSSPNNAVGPNGLLEKDITLDIGRRVAALLGNRANVILTRTGDENRSLSDRAKIARDADADVFLSIHLNGWKDASVDGSEAWVAGQASGASHALARSVLDRVLTVTHAHDRGVREQDFGVLLPQRQGPRTAASLLEVAFLTNPDEASRFTHDEYKQALALAIADGITAQLRTNGTAATATALTTTAQQEAIDVVNAFRAETSTGAFTPRRDDVADRALALVNDPTFVEQGALGLCGPAAVHRLWIKRDPKAFATYLTTMYDTGSASFGDNSISAGSDLRNQDYYGRAVPAMQAVAPAGADTAQFVCPSADWVAMSALRDASNIFLDFEGLPDEEYAAGTSSSEVAAWLRSTGLYASVSDEGNFLLTKGLDHAEALQPGAENDVVLLINAHILTSSAVHGHKKSDEFIGRAFPNHFVVLESAVTEPTADEVEFDCWTWGAVVHVRLRKDVFNPNYYGAVIARVTTPAATSSALAVAAAQPPVDGIDVDTRDGIPSWADLRADALSFAIFKATEGTYFTDDGTLSDSITGASFAGRYADGRANHVLVGAYHYGTTHEPKAAAPALADAPAYFRDQADYFMDVVGRVLPGNLPPSYDFEHKNNVDTVSPPPNLGWRGADWLAPMEAFLDRLETRSGRVPMIYTSDVVWQDSVGGDGSFGRFGDYPLWVKQYFLPENSRYRKRLTSQPALPGPWSDWAIWQYSGDYTPTEFPILARVRKKSGKLQESDLNVANGGIHVLRGFADLGRPAPHGDSVRFVAYADEHGEIKVLSFLGFWLEASLTDMAQDPNTRQAPWAAGDVAACEIGDRQYVAYRSRDDGNLYEIARGGGASVAPENLTITGARPVGHFSYVVDGTDRLIVYWGEDDHIHLLANRGGTWQLPMPDFTAGAGIDAASGNPAAYVSGGNLHVVGRTGSDGHLVDAWRDGAQWNKVDLTDRSGAPAATYQPTTYTGSDGRTRVVYRALRGEIHQLDRNDQTVTDQPLSPGAPTCAGNPAAFVLNGVPHVVYRRTDGRLHEIAGDGAGGFTNAPLPCTDRAAADPGVSVGTDGGQPAAFVVCRDRDGAFHELTLNSAGWTCRLIEPTRNPPPPNDTGVDWQPPADQ